MTENNYPTFNGVSILSLKPSKDTKSSTSTYMYEGTTKYSTISTNTYGLSFILENRNNFVVNASLQFNKIQNRDKDGVLLNENIPMAHATIPPNEKVIAILNLGQNYPMKQDDIRLNDIFLEYIGVNGQWSKIINIQVYSPDKLTNYSNISSKRLKRMITWLFFGVCTITLIGNIAQLYKSELGTPLMAITGTFSIYMAFIHTFKKTYFSDFA